MVIETIRDANRLFDVMLDGDAVHASDIQDVLKQAISAPTSTIIVDLTNGKFDGRKRRGISISDKAQRCRF